MLLRCTGLEEACPERERNVRGRKAGAGEILPALSVPRRCRRGLSTTEHRLVTVVR